MTMTRHEAPLETVVETPLHLRPTSDSFHHFGVSEEVIEALALRNINEAFPIQALVLRDALAGRDVLAKSQTGSGKTLAYAIPIVERLTPDDRSPTALVLVPTRELATQVAQEFRGIADVKRMKVATVYGGVALREQAHKAARSDVVIATPGRLLDLVGRKMLRLDRVRICILDEADRMLDMGFLPDVGRILGMLPGDRQTAFFSATLDGEVGYLARRFTRDAVLHEIVEERPVVDEAVHRFLAVEPRGKVDALVRELAGDRDLTLIFVRTKRGADWLASALRARGFGAGALHGDMAQTARERSLARFAGGKADVLVATDVAARGLDLQDITHVVNFDPPEDEKAYVHRVGRTARAGRAGMGITLVTPDQMGDVGRIAARLKLHVEFKESGMQLPPPRPVFAGARSRRRPQLLRPRRPRRR